MRPLPSPKRVSRSASVNTWWALGSMLGRRRRAALCVGGGWGPRGGAPALGGGWGVLFA
jgi:hypothetical protein